MGALYFAKEQLAKRVYAAALPPAAGIIDLGETYRVRYRSPLRGGVFLAIGWPPLRTAVPLLRWPCRPNRCGRVGRRGGMKKGVE